MAHALQPAKWSYITRRIGDRHVCGLGPIAERPETGDLVVAKIARIGNHTHLENTHGRRCRLYPGDLIVGAYGNRYASDYYEGYVGAGRTAHLLAASGLIGQVASTHTRYAEPTLLEIIGSLSDETGTPQTLETFARPTPTAYPPRFGTWVVVGSAMNAGKTTTSAAIVRGWARAGLNPGAGKVTGCGSGKDLWSYIDAGAQQVCDFLDFGIASTYGYPVHRLQRTMAAIRDALVADGADVVVLEIADGLLQPETRGLLPALRGFADGLVLAVGDPLAAKTGADMLRGDYDLPLRAVSGLITTSPLATREAAAVTGLPVLSPSSLAEGAAMDLLSADAQVA